MDLVALETIYLPRLIARGFHHTPEAQEQSASVRCMSRQTYALMFGPTTGDRVRLGDTDLMIEIEKDWTVYGDECTHVCVSRYVSDIEDIDINRWIHSALWHVLGLLWRVVFFSILSNAEKCPPYDRGLFTFLLNMSHSDIYVIMKDICI